jgi:hypothetical protein
VLGRVIRHPRKGDSITAIAIDFIASASATRVTLSPTP